ncbi:hypothetical protein GUJ93_ZPchr0010g10805 [Zizania palustris]|uniref:Uncharacterized protein n=1 Tax=Zizania palustris TaxID=103762 RepID=A0A8J6BKI8_ZIZPA|nr:hypothetical protein GUJ93_ZPchr0010g10805 [Zizania palustris]
MENEKDYPFPFLPSFVLACSTSLCSQPAEGVDVACSRARPARRPVGTLCTASAPPRHPLASSRARPASRFRGATRPSSFDQPPSRLSEHIQYVG